MRLLFLISICEAFNIVSDSTEKQLTDVIINIMSRYHMANNRSTLILYGSLPAEIIEYASKLTDIVTMDGSSVQKGFEIELPMDPTENYIQRPAGMILIYARSYEDITAAFVQIMNTIYWSVEAYVVVYSKRSFYLPLLFYLFYWYNLPFALLLQYDERFVRVSEYNPFNERKSNVRQFGCYSMIGVDEAYEGDMFGKIQCNDSCDSLDFNRFSDTMYVQSCTEITTRIYNRNLPIFRDFSINLNGYPLLIFGAEVQPALTIDNDKNGLGKFGGKDGTLFRLLADKMNFTVTHTSVGSNGLANIQMFVKGVMDLAFRRNEIYANTVYMIPFSFPPITVTYPVEKSGLCFLIHRAEFIPTWVNFMTMFDRSSFILISIVFHAIVLLYVYFLRRLRKSGYFDAFQGGYLYTMQLFLSLPIDWVGKNSSLRIFVFLIFWFVFVINFIFQGLIVSLLTIPRSDADINTFEELYATGYNIEGMPSPDKYLPPTSDLFIGINNRFVINEKIYGCSDDLKNRAPKACWMDCLLAERLIKIARDDDGKLYLHLGVDRVHSHFYAYPLPKGSPLKTRIDHYIVRASEAGLNKKWREADMPHIVESNVYIKKLNLDDLQGCFYLLGLGYAISTLTFIIECLKIYAIVPCFQTTKKFMNYLVKYITEWKFVRRPYETT